MRFLCRLLFLTLALAPAPLAAEASGMTGNFMAPAPAASGRWITANHDAVVQIAPCGADLCGRIVGMVLAPGEPIPKDWKGASQCGLTIIRVSPDPGKSGASWSGSVLDPRDGSVYDAQITLGVDHQLKLRGYVGLPIFGQTQSWNKFQPTIPADCRLTSG